MSVADKLLTVANNVSRVFAAGEAKHTARYAAAIAVGDGTRFMSFAVPFEADLFCVAAHGAEALSNSNSVLQLVFDSRAFAKRGGCYRILQDGAPSGGYFSSATGGNYFKVADGICTVEAPASLGVNFINGTQYACTAVKYTDKSDGELLEEEIALLSDTGEVLEYSSARVLSTVTEEEWQTLIANKPNRTFTLV